MDQWEHREQKLRGRKSRMEKHGRSILTAISAAERRREEELRKRATRRQAKARRAKQASP